MIPGDVQEAAVKASEATLKTNADTSADAMKKMVDAFKPFKVTKEQIEKRIQRRLDAIQPAQVVSLKKIYASLRDGMSIAADWFDTDETAQDLTQRILGDDPVNTGDANDIGGLTAKEVHEGLVAATTLSELDEACDLISMVPQEDRAALMEFYVARQKELSK